MAGRGRGGKTSSLTQEQLQNLGCAGKDMPQVQTAPPPTYPPLMSKPVALELTAEQNYQILWKEDFLTHLRDSACYLQPSEKANSTNSSADGSKGTNPKEIKKTKLKIEFNWSLMPLELQMIKKKRKVEMPKKQIIAKKKKAENIDDRLKQLEEKESKEVDTDAAAKANSDSEEEMEELGEVVDDEMDDENDYGNSYFDNGEAYNEEDDNLDDGPVY